MDTMEISPAEEEPPPPTEQTGLLASQQDNGAQSGGGRNKQKRFRSSSVFVEMDKHASRMTYSRRLAMYLSRFDWYYPHRKAKEEYDSKRKEEGFGDDDFDEAADAAGAPPSLSAAWSYFEYVSLPRHFIRPPGAAVVRGKGMFQKAEVGESEKPTNLYPVFGTPEVDLADFGMGVGLYFFTLRYLAIVLFIAGCINIPVLLFYSSDLYNDDEAGGINNFLLRSTAICTDTTWVACPTCTLEQWDYFPYTNDRYAYANGTDGSILKFIKSNNCYFSDKVGYLSFAILMFVSVAIIVLCYRVIKRKEIAFDEAAQTTSDYSVQVDNPPGDARDVEEWKEFFSQFGQVTYCTVVLDNEDLIRALVERRKLLLQLKWLRKPGTKFDKFDLDAAVENALPLTFTQKLMFYSNAETLRAGILDLDKKIEEFSSTPKDTTEVFVIFQTELEQRRALKALSQSRWTLWTNSSLPKNLMFRGNHWLRVKEPPEPSTVRWEDLDTTLSERAFRRCVTSLLSLGMLIGGCLLITWVRRDYGAAAGALAITALNTAAPYACQYITDYEFHKNEGKKQASRYNKINLAMWVFTAIITGVITPFTDTVSNSDDSIIRSLYAIYFFELLRGPITQALDVSGNFYRHVLGPRSADQESMNLNYQGTVYELSERYTNMTSMLFLTFYYGTIFPSGFFFAAVILTVHYWIDKYCLLRLWAQAPKMGSEISRFCRMYIVITLVVFVFFSSYFVAGVPFDNVCDDDESRVSPEYIGNWTVTVGDNSTSTTTIEEGDINHFYCNQDMLRYKPHPAFPAIPENQPEGLEWMDERQENVSSLYGFTSVCVVIAVVAILGFRFFRAAYRFVFASPYKPQGQPSDIRYDDVEEIYGYVPQIRVEGLPFPMIVCDVSKVDHESIGWNDPFRGHEFHNILLDVPGLIEKENVFSIVKDWPDPTAVEEEETGVLT